jgi:hypothetical protein
MLNIQHSPNHISEWDWKNRKRQNLIMEGLIKMGVWHEYDEYQQEKIKSITLPKI